MHKIFYLITKQKEEEEEEKGYMGYTAIRQTDKPIQH